MAQTATQRRELIDKWLDLALDAWRQLPEVEKEIDSWDPDEQVDFLVQWPVEEERLARLTEYAASGAMTEEQAARLRELEKIVAENRPIIERLLET